MVVVAAAGSGGAAAAIAGAGAGVQPSAAVAAAEEGAVVEVTAVISVAPPPVEALSGWPGREQPSGSRSGRRAAFLLVGGTQGWNDPYSTSQCEVGIHLLHIFTKDLDELLR